MQKKLFLSLAIIVVVLSGCSSSQSMPNAVKVEAMNPKKYELLKVAGITNSLGFNLTVPEAQKTGRLSYSIDHYKNGQMAEENTPTLMSPVDSNVQNIEIYFSSLNFNQGDEHGQWVLAIRQIQQDGEVLVTTSSEIAFDESKQQTLTPIQEEATFQENQEVPIGIMLIDPNVFDSPVYPTDITRIAKASKEAYVLKVKLTDLTTNP